MWWKADRLSGLDGDAMESVESSELVNSSRRLAVSASCTDTSESGERPDAGVSVMGLEGDHSDDVPNLFAAIASKLQNWSK